MKTKIFGLTLMGLMLLNFTNAQTVDNSLVNALDKNQQIDIQFKQFDSCDQMEKVLSGYIGSYQRYYNGPMVTQENFAKGGSMPESTPTQSTSARDEGTTSSTTSYSSTNLQKLGVEEPEIIKTDGKYIYYYNQKNQKIYIVASPLDIKTSKININNSNIKTIINLPSDMYNVNLFVTSNRLIIIGTKYNNNYKSDSVLDSYYRSFAAIYDTSNIANPKLTKLTDIDGSYQDARMIGNRLYVLSSMGVRWYYYKPYITKVSNIMPSISDTVNKKTKNIKADCKSISYILPSEDTMKKLNLYPDFTVITMIDTKDLTKDSKLQVLLGQSSSIHMSKSSLFLAQNIYSPYPWSCAGGLKCIMPIYQAGEETLVHKFDINTFQITYKASNLIPGTLLNQYSMDQDNNGLFRILTKKYDKQTNTNLYILNRSLGLEGKLENIEPGEDFKSSRYIGDKLYLVTYQYVDPLFVIDMANSKNPKIVGSLKIPGYSTYLQPFGGIVGGKQYLIGLGYMTTTNSRGSTINSGIQLSLFSVDYNRKNSDGNINVSRVDAKVLGGEGSRSEALDNPRMFVMNSKGTVTMPMILTSKVKSGENCSISYDPNGKEIYRSCRPIEDMIISFAGLKSFQFDKMNGIKESFSKDFQQKFKDNIKGGELESWTLRSTNMRVGFAGDALYMFNNDFANFNNSGTEKYLEFK